VTPRKQLAARRAFKGSAGPRVPIHDGRVRALMQWRDLSPGTLAPLVGVSEQRVRQLLSQERCTRRVRQRLARVLGTNEDYLSGDPHALPGLDGVRDEIISARSPVARELRDRVGALRGAPPDVPLPPHWEMASLAVYRQVSAMFGRDSDIGLVIFARHLCDVGLWRDVLQGKSAEDSSWSEADYNEFAESISKAVTVVLRPFVEGDKKPSKGGAALLRLLSLTLIELFRTSAEAPQRSAGAVSTDTALVAATEHLEKALYRFLFPAHASPGPATARRKKRAGK
jgi:hypothetical protein